MKKLSSIIIILIFSFLKLHAQCVITGNLSVCVGSTTQLSGTGTPVETDPWLSQSTDVATISNTGLVTGIQSGTSLITYTTTDCFSTVTVTVLDWVNPTFSAVGPYCVGATPGILPATSTNGITGSWNPSSISTASAGITTYTFTPDAGQCATTANISVTINSNDITPTFSALGPYCIGATPGTLSTTSSNGIAGSWDPATVSTSSAGTTTYTFTPDAGQCATTANMSVTINSNDITPTFASVGPYCIGAAIPALPATSTNGITGSWSPSINNTATTLYTFTPTAGQCATIAELTITINPNTITPTFIALGPYCVGATAGTLPGTSTNGITGTWNPATISTATAGTSVYTFTPTAGQCANTVTMSVVVNANMTPTFTALGPYCVGATPGTLPGTSTNGITGTWNPATISTASAGTTVFTFTPTVGQCATTTTMSIVVNTNVIPTFTPVSPYCSGATIPPLPTTSNNSISGTWNPAINNTATTTYTFTPTAGQCATTTTLTITINSNTTPTFAAVGSYCSGAAISALPTTSTNGITGTWSPAINNTVTTTYTFTPTTGQCATPTTLTITIIALPATPAVGTITQPTCAIGTGSVILNGLPSSGTWTITRTPGNTTTTGTGTGTTISGIPAGIFTFTVTNASGCTSAASGNAMIDAQPSTPTAPSAGTITHPTCTVATGSISVNGLPSSGTWTLTRTPGAVTATGTGISTTISGLPAGTYTFTVTNSSGCTSISSVSMVINTQPATPTAPTVGTITHPTCEVGAGSVILSGLPSSGNWTITRIPGSTTMSGTGTSTTISGLAANTYTFTVTLEGGCTSSASGSVVINAQPSTPTAPAISTITQPTCSAATGSVVLNGLPESGTWTLARTPGAVTTTGTGTSTTISGLAANTYTFTVTLEGGCTSSASGSVVINAQPSTPTAPVVGTITQPTCTVATGGVVLNGLPATGTWTLTRSPGGTTITGSGTGSTITGLPAGTYSYIVTNASSCISPASANIVINLQPSTPTAPTVGTITHPTCSLATGIAVLNGLPSTGSWTLTRTPGGTTSTGTGISMSIPGIPAGSYTFTVTNAAECSSTASGNAVINAQPPTPTAPVIVSITQPTLSVPTGSVVLSGLPATGAWTLTRTPGGTITAGTGLSTTISGLAPGTYSFSVTNASGCTSLPSVTFGLFTLKLYGPDQNILHSNDIIKIDNSDAGSISINVESNTDWAVSENSLWLKAVKESGSSKITVTYLENISAKAKVAAIRVSYTSNPDFVVNIQQKARVSQLNNSKFDNIKIYPNPANDIVYLNFGIGEFEKVLISITNIQGFTMSTEEYSDITTDQTLGLNISELPIGQYLINIGDGIHSKSFHLIKY